MSKQSTTPNSGPHARAEGYTLSVLLVMLVALGVFMQRAHLWAPTQINREREAELIYRGEHLARGIASYRQKTGRYPTSLGEVAALRPRVIREVYRDPMTESGQWAYIYAVPTAPSGNNEGLPIVGVRSTSSKDSIKRYQYKSLHSDWEFSALNPLLGGPQPNQAAPRGSTTSQSTQQNNSGDGSSSGTK